MWQDRNADIHFKREITQYPFEIVKANEAISIEK